MKARAVTSFGSEAGIFESHSFTNGFAQMSTSKHSNQEDLPLARKPDITIKRTAFATCLNLICTMVGAGVLGFPGTIKKGGFCASTIILLITAWAVAEVGEIIAKTLELCEEMASRGEQFRFGLRPKSYEDMAEAALGSSGSVFVGCLVNMFMLVLCGVFMILIGQSLEMVSQVILPYRAWVLIIMILFVPMTLTNDMSTISKLSAVGVAASCIYVVCMTQAGLEAGLSPAEKRYKNFPNQMTDLGVVVAVMLCGFSCQVVIPTVRADMKSPEDFPKANRWAVCAVTIIYLICGLIGYYGWGEDVKDLITQSMVPMLAGKVLSFAVIANLCVSFPLIMHCVANAVERAATDGKYSVALRLTLLGTALTLALLCPFFLEVWGLIASVLGVTTAFFVPLAVYWRMVCISGSLKNEPQSFIAMQIAKHVFITILATTTLFVGTFGAVTDLQAAFQKPGANPFTNFWSPSQ